MLNLTVLGSSSKGNCYIITAGAEKLVIECGIKYAPIMTALDFRAENVKGVLISHEHKDHSASAAKLAAKGFNLYASAGTFEALGLTGHRAHRIASEQQFTVGGFTILPFAAEHDAKEPLGFIIYHALIGKLLFATDTYYISYKFSGLNYIMVECNFSREIVQNNHLDKVVENRLYKSHFSLENVKKFLAANDLSKCECIYLIHLSDGNSDAKLFKSEVEKLAGIPVEIC